MRSNYESYKMETIIKLNELNTKDNGNVKRQEISKDYDKNDEENFSLKNNNYFLQSKLHTQELEINNGYELEIQYENQEIKHIKEIHEKEINKLKESINKKNEIIQDKDQINKILCDLLKARKAEVNCLETRQNAENRHMLDNIRLEINQLLEK